MRKSRSRLDPWICQPCKPSHLKAVNWITQSHRVQYTVGLCCLSVITLDYITYCLFSLSLKVEGADRCQSHLFGHIYRTPISQPQPHVHPACEQILPLRTQMASGKSQASFSEAQTPPPLRFRTWTSYVAPPHLWSSNYERVWKIAGSSSQ